MARNLARSSRWSQPSILVVLSAGALTVFFLTAIVREIVRSATVRRQVDRLRQELAVEAQRQGELDDLIGYLASPTFQEREARLKLNLKKSGERVIVIPTDDNTNAVTGRDGQPIDADSTLTKPPGRWWNYFFGARTSS